MQKRNAGDQFKMPNGTVGDAVLRVQDVVMCVCINAWCFLGFSKTKYLPEKGIFGHRIFLGHQVLGSELCSDHPKVPSKVFSKILSFYMSIMLSLHCTLYRHVHTMLIAFMGFAPKWGSQTSVNDVT